MKFTILVKKQLISKINELFKPFSEMFCALDDRCQSGDGKTQFGAKIANDMATVDSLKIDSSEHMCPGPTFLSGQQNPYKTP